MLVLVDMERPDRDLAAGSAGEAGSGEDDDHELVVANDCKQAAGGVDYDLVDREREVRGLERLGNVSNGPLVKRSTHLVRADTPSVYLPSLPCEGGYSDLLSKRDDQVLIAHGDARVSWRREPIGRQARSVDQFPTIIGGRGRRGNENGVRAKRLEREWQGRRHVCEAGC